jgi:hypothetical protein
MNNGSMIPRSSAPRRFNHIPESYSQPLGVESAMEIISSFISCEIKKNLPEEGARMFFIAIQLGRFTNSSLVRESGKSKQFINKYIQLFLRYGYIRMAEIVGQNHFYEIDTR